jgi:hypothetical protein
MPRTTSTVTPIAGDRLQARQAWLLGSGVSGLISSNLPSRSRIVLAASPKAEGLAIKEILAGNLANAGEEALGGRIAAGVGADAAGPRPEAIFIIPAHRRWPVPLLQPLDQGSPG